MDLVFNKALTKVIPIAKDPETSQLNIPGLICYRSEDFGSPDPNQKVDTFSWLLKQLIGEHYKKFKQFKKEMAEFDEEEKKLLLKDYGIKESGLDTLIKEAYNTLGLETFFTCGEKEVRAWTMKKGSQAVEAAGEIHTDFSTKFIKAEIYTYDDAINNEEKINELKTLGLVKMVGRDYIMQEGDIAYFIKGQ